jgi:hypothetical protein
MARETKQGKEEDEKSFQINVRMTQAEIDLIDEKRIEGKAEKGAIPSRSDIVRDALAAYLGRDKKKRG